jgi:hypothetical protein
MKNSVWLFAGLLGIFFSTGNTSPFKSGNVELSGSGSFSSSSPEDGPARNTTTLEPSLSFYVSPNFYIGPSLQYQRVSKGDASQSATIIAANAGFLLDTRDPTSATPYVGAALGAISGAYDNGYDIVSISGTMLSFFWG